jgi:cysteine synthase A
MQIKPPQVVKSSLDTIGMTPVVKLNKVVPPGCAHVFIKLEYFNPTGSYKDRMALAMIEEAEARGDLVPGMEVVEYTGGSTGSSLAYVCAVKGYQFTVVSSDAFSQEKLDTMRAFGADLIIVPSKGGVVTPDLVPRMIEKAQSIADERGAYFTDQLNNSDSIIGYRKMGSELAEQVGPEVDAYCAGVGTAGNLMGVAQELKRVHREIKIVALEPASSAVISGGEPGKHHVEGIGIGYIPPHLDPDYYDEARSVDEGEARKMARSLANEEGIFTGTSTGLNVVGAIQLAQELGPHKVVATVAVDTGLKYLAGDLYSEDA